MFNFGASPSGKAAGFDPAIRRFESFCPRFRNGNRKGDRVADGIALLMRRTIFVPGVQIPSFPIKLKKKEEFNIYCVSVNILAP